MWYVHPPPCPSLSPFCFRLSWRSKAFPTQREHWRYAEHRHSLRPARAVAITSVRREASHDGPDTRQLLTAESTHVRPPGDSESHRIDSEGPQHSPCIPPGPLASPQTTGTRHAHTYNSRNGHTSEKKGQCAQCVYTIYVRTRGVRGHYILQIMIVLSNQAHPKVCNRSQRSLGAPSYQMLRERINLALEVELHAPSTHTLSTTRPPRGF